MAQDANSPRLAAVRLLKVQIEAVRLSAGILVKATRAYKRGKEPDGLRQQDVAKASGLHQPEISDFENGGKVPEESKLQRLLEECGFHIDAVGSGGNALLELLTFLRKYGDDIGNIEREKPEEG